jgi:7-cyano-7-deazaguanine synthase
MDSATALGIAKKRDIANSALHFEYYQKNSMHETVAFNNLCDYYKIENKLTVSLDFLAKIGTSALTDSNITIPKHEIPQNVIPETYVPFRNGIMLSMAAAWAETIDAHVIYTGFVEEDSSGYPDCREEFVKARNIAVNLGRRPESACTIEAPLLHLTKAQILTLGMTLNVPYHLTWSCYEGYEKPCGQSPLAVCAPELLLF